MRTSGTYCWMIEVVLVCATNNKTLHHTLQHTLQHPAISCNTLQHTAKHCDTLPPASKTICWVVRRVVQYTLQHTAPHTASHTAPHSATPCTTLHHPAPPCTTLQHTHTWMIKDLLGCAKSVCMSSVVAHRLVTLLPPDSCCSMLQYVAVSCSELQCANRRLLRIDLSPAPPP